MLQQLSFVLRLTSSASSVFQLSISALPIVLFEQRQFGRGPLRISFVCQFRFYTSCRTRPTQHRFPQFAWLVEHVPSSIVLRHRAFLPWMGITPAGHFSKDDRRNIIGSLPSASLSEPLFLRRSSLRVRYRDPFTTLTWVLNDLCPPVSILRPALGLSRLRSRCLSDACPQANVPFSGGRWPVTIC